jgi:hypothetical protein
MARQTATSAQEEMIHEFSELKRICSTSQKTLWVGALSFEERCVGSLAACEMDGVKCSNALILRYDSTIEPKRDADEKIAKHLRILNSFRGSVVNRGIVIKEVEPYSFQGFELMLQQALEQWSPEFVIFDITCFTKVHTLALATMLAEKEPQFQWVAAYTIPENYASIGSEQGHKVRQGWRDIIVAPLADTAMLFNEAHSRGVIIVGHESDRLIVALAELEPSGGLILKAYNPERPDLHRVSDNHNRKIIRQLTRMRASEWTQRVVDLSKMEPLQKCIDAEIVAAKRHAAPVIFFPYGPKLLVFYAAFELAEKYRQASWFVYPVPTSYPAAYSEGIEKTIWQLGRTDFDETRHSQSRIAYLMGRSGAGRPEKAIT